MKNWFWWTAGAIQGTGTWEPRRGSVLIPGDSIMRIWWSAAGACRRGTILMELDLKEENPWVLIVRMMLRIRLLGLRRMLGLFLGGNRHMVWLRTRRPRTPLGSWTWGRRTPVRRTRTRDLVIFIGLAEVIRNLWRIWAKAQGLILVKKRKNLRGNRLLLKRARRLLISMQIQMNLLESPQGSG